MFSTLTNDITGLLTPWKLLVSYMLILYKGMFRQQLSDKHRRTSTEVLQESHTPLVTLNNNFLLRIFYISTTRAVAWMAQATSVLPEEANMGQKQPKTVPVIKIIFVWTSLQKAFLYKRKMFSKGALNSYGFYMLKHPSCINETNATVLNTKIIATLQH